MRGIASLLAALMLLSPQAAAAQSTSFDADTSRITPGPPPGTKPLTRARFDDSVARLFAAGDSNRDGTITLAEFNAIVGAARDRAIGERFAAIDSNRDKALSLAEFAEWQRRMGSTVLADGSAAGGGGLVAEEIMIDFGRGDDDVLIERVIEPLTATALVEANEDYSSGVTLAELVAWEARAFDRADENDDNFVTVGEIDARKPARD